MLSVPASGSRVLWVSLACLAVGLALSLGIAWASVYIFLGIVHTRPPFGPPHQYAFGPGPEDDRWSVHFHEYPLGVTRGEISKFRGAHWSWFDENGVERFINFSGPDTLPAWSRGREFTGSEPRGYKTYEIGAGWPFTAWKGEWRTLYGDSEGSACWYCVFMPGGLDPERPVLLPYHPVFPGFLYNIIFYGVAAYVGQGLFYMLPRALRRRRRRRKNRCSQCGYDANGLKRCPECGSENRA